MEKPVELKDIQAGDYGLSEKTGKLNGPARLSLSTDKIASFSITLYNDAGQKLVIGYDKDSNNYYIDRAASGKTDFDKRFP